MPVEYVPNLRPALELNSTMSSASSTRLWSALAEVDPRLDRARGRNHGRPGPLRAGVLGDVHLEGVTLRNHEREPAVARRVGGDPGNGSLAPPVRSGKEGPVAGVTEVPLVVVTGKAVKVAPPSRLV